MSTDSKSDALLHLADALSEDILNTPDEDLLAEVAADHEDPRALANEFDRVCRRALRRVRRQEYIERLKQLINVPVPAPRFATISIAALAVIVIAIALSDRSFRSVEKQLTNLASPAAEPADPIVVAGAPKVAPQGLPLSAPAASNITGPGERASLSTLLDKDKRAITIRVDDVRGVAGFILPNDRVDVVLIRGASNGSGSRQSDLLLQDVKVIAIDQIASQQKDNPVVAKAVTLEVTPYEAQKTSLATKVGSLSLILRKAGDVDVVARSRVTEIDLSDEPRPAPPPPGPTSVRIEAPPPPPPSDATVTIISNHKGVDYKVMGRQVPPNSRAVSDTLSAAAPAPGEGLRATAPPPETMPGKASALAALQYAASQGQPVALWKLGRMYADGDGVPRDDLRAFNYFSEIANSHPDEAPGTPQAQVVANAFVALGHYYLTGIPNSKITADRAHAHDFFTYAATYFGDADAQYALGRLYLTDTPSDPHQAARWLQLAATKGQCRAKVALGDMLFQGQVVPRQAARGLMWLTLGRDCTGVDESWVKPIYDNAFEHASDDERALALVYLEDWLKGHRD